MTFPTILAAWYFIVLMTGFEFLFFFKGCFEWDRNIAKVQTPG